MAPTYADLDIFMTRAGIRLSETRRKSIFAHDCTIVIMSDLGNVPLPPRRRFRHRTAGDLHNLLYGFSEGPITFVRIT